MESARSFLDDAVSYAQENGWQPPKLNDLLLRAAALALARYPQINASLLEGEILYHKEINIGLVVALNEGLIIPVIHKANEKNIYSLAIETNQAIERARGQQLTEYDLTGSTFTLSNLGMFGLDSFVAVINPPEAGVLAIGAVKSAPAVIGDQVLPRRQMEVVLSVDHRIVDGRVAAQFMENFRRNLEVPIRLALGSPEEGG
jgi:pyruvate dehydrogenase E2 component (dihydrolipoamide acetyltransferase)